MGTTSMLALVAFAALVVLGQAQELPPPVTGADFNDTMCGACLMTMSNLDTVLDTKESADQVKQFATSVCGHLPKDHVESASPAPALSPCALPSAWCRRPTSRSTATRWASAPPPAPRRRSTRPASAPGGTPRRTSSTAGRVTTL